MSREPVAFFAVEYGSATVSASLIGRLGPRFRLLGATAAPAGVPADALLADLVQQVVAADADALPGAARWPEWARLEAGTAPPGRILCAAGSERRLEQLETAAENAGWEIAARLTPDRTPPITAMEACFDRSVEALLVGAGDPAGADERDALPDLCALLGAAAMRRGDLLCLLSGAAARHADKFPADRVVLAPVSEPAPSGARTPLRDLAEELAARHVTPDGRARPLPDARRGFRATLSSLAALLERRVEAVDVGARAGSRALATPEGARAHLVRADAALVPAEAMSDDEGLDAILRWAAIRGDASTLRDRLRAMRLAPWRAASGEGAQLRIAAARAALMRLEETWELPVDPGSPADQQAPDLLIASGGAFAVAPAPAVALALLDTLRRPGGIGLYLDHARLLGPLGTIDSEGDRRRLLVDLLDEILVPLGSAILATGLGPGRRAGTLRVTSDGMTNEVPLVPNAIQLVDLAPGMIATAEVETRGAWLGVRSRRLALDVAGGLGGLLVDTRPIPLRLPDRADQRRELLESWQRPMWVGQEA